MTRIEARNNAFLLLFETAFDPAPDRESILALAAEHHGIETDDFVLSVYNGVLDQQDEIDAEIEKYCQRRALNRLSKMLLTALRIAVFELRNTETAPAVVINEAVELIKTYDSPEAAAYGNGVLGSYVRAR